MLIVISLIMLAALAWGLWNLHQKVQRLDALIERWDDTLATLGEGEVVERAPDSLDAATTDMRVIIEITDAVSLARRYHWAGGAGALAPNVLKKTMQTRVLEETRKAIQEGGHQADVKVIVL